MKMLTVSLLVCAMMTGSAANTETEEDPSEPFEMRCPEGWTEFPSRCILYIPQKMTWAEAEENCSNKDGHLASASDDMYANEIASVLHSAGVKSGGVWVGGTNTAEDLKWHWTDGMISVFIDWCSGNAENHMNHCLHLTVGEKLCLDDRQCDAELPSVCITYLMGQREM